MPAALPVNHEHNLSRRIIDVHNDLVDQDADDALFESHVRGRVVPQRWQILSERVQGVCFDVLRRDRARIEGRETRLDVTYQTQEGEETASFTGVLVWRLLERAGGINESDSRAILRHTLVITGRDGYAVALSVGEIDPKLADEPAIIAYLRNDQPFDSGETLRERLKPSARLLALMLASIDLVLLPYGTALGIYALWTLLHEDGRRQFQ